MGDAFLIGWAGIVSSCHNLPRSVTFWKANYLTLWNLLISGKDNELVSSTLTRLRHAYSES